MKTEIEIDVKSEQLAELFINWDNAEQAMFINLIGEHFKMADFDAEGQCCSITKEITKLGKDFIYTLANFLKVQKVSWRSGHYDMLINMYDGDTLRNTKM
jgi:hypothetical protein